MTTLMGNQDFVVYRNHKMSPSRRLKNMLKPILRRVFKTRAKQQANRNSYVSCSTEEDDYDEFAWLNNDMDNMANEHLEDRLIDEIQHCEDDAAIVVYNEEGDEFVEPIDKCDYYVPVHFARTNAGTFFWTSMQRETMQPYQIEWNFLDRWGQA